MPVTEGFDAYAAPYIDSGIASNYYLRDPLLYVLTSLTNGNTKPTGREIGRPAGAEVLAGTKLSSIQRKALSGISTYFGGFQFQNPTNVKIMGATDTSPKVSASSSQTVNQGNLRGTFEVRWTGVIKEQIKVWRTRLDNAVQDAGQSAEGRGIARAKVLEEAIDVATQNVYGKISTEIWTGSPTDQDEKPWDHLLGVAGWFDDSNLWARVNRAVAKNATFRSNKDTTTRAPVLADLLDVANIDYGIEDKINTFGAGGENTQLLVCNNACYKAFKAEVLGKGGVELLDGLPNMGQYGVRRPVLRKDNVIIVRASLCPASTAYLFYLPVWKWIPNVAVPMKATPFRYLPEFSEGADDAYQAFVEMQAMLCCDNPGLNVAFTAITDPT